MIWGKKPELGGYNGAMVYTDLGVFPYSPAFDLRQIGMKVIVEALTLDDDAAVDDPRRETYSRFLAALDPATATGDEALAPEEEAICFDAIGRRFLAYFGATMSYVGSGARREATLSQVSLALDEAARSLLISPAMPDEVNRG